MNKTAIRTLQRVLAEAGTYQGAIDGIRGPLTRQAVEAMLESHADKLPAGAGKWSERRRAIACLQIGCLEREIEVGPIDGLWGPQTDFAADALAELFATGEPPRPWRDPPQRDANPNGWPREASISEVFGQPCEVPQVTVPCPWPLVLAWDLQTRVSGIGCHRRVAESLERVLARVHDHYGSERLKELGLHRYGGCHNCRRKRGGSSWSTHAWAIAIDWDPSHNKLRWGRDRARLARPEYDTWWEIWEEEGWISLGRARNFDWMHVQAARL
ncbi:peptidoglycan-binding domain-containing protein [Halomonas sp. BM-2019]|uniref:peptidoglycan-binding domain-containing protein n=1 Tax=Halomonas sp. BM-2019 TaxID=2811227 RepID=UPI001B3C4895|nr:MAG: peptidoglycan-binding protein [Halomonas sp. BM-2019]